MGACLLVSIRYAVLPLVYNFYLFSLYQGTRPICVLLVYASGVVSNNCGDLVCQELCGARRGVDGWLGGVKDRFIYQGRDIVVTFLPQEVGKLGGLCDADWPSLSLAFFSCDVAHDYSAVRAHLLQSVGFLFDHQHGRLGVEPPVINYSFRFGQ